MLEAPTAPPSTGEGIPIVFSALLIVLAAFGITCATLVGTAGNLRRDLEERMLWLGAVGAMEESLQYPRTSEPSQGFATLTALHSMSEALTASNPMDAELAALYEDTVRSLGIVLIAARDRELLRTNRGAALVGLTRMGKAIREQSAQLTARLSETWNRIYTLIFGTLLMVTVLAAFWLASKHGPAVPSERRKLLA